MQTSTCCWCTLWSGCGNTLSSKPVNITVFLNLRSYIAFLLSPTSAYSFTALKVVPDTYTDDGTWPDSDNEWTFVDGDPAYITHQRSDNTRFKWEYDAGVNTGTDSDTTGYLLGREALTNE